MDRSDPSAGSLLERLKERKVVQWTLAYLSAAWLILQVVDVIGEQFAWPLALERGITMALVLGLPAAVILAWYHGEKGHQQVTRTETLLLGAVVLLGAGALVGTIGRTPTVESPLFVPDAGGGEVPFDAAVLAVLPFAPTAADSELTRLGRDLAVTVAATLDGIDDLRTVDGLTILAHSPPDSAALPLRSAQILAERLGAGRLLRGTVARQGDGVRVDATLHTGDAPLHGSITVADARDLAALTDSLALTVLRLLWTGGTPELPSPAALATGSAEALRAYTAGEEALAAGEMMTAVTAFERALTYDSTYWFAYWRSLYPRIYEGSRADPELVSKVVENRYDFPLADRLLVEAYTAETASEELRLLEEATRRFPTHWPAWYSRANFLVHNGPYLGTSYAAARAALERVTALNPGFASGWEHLLWMVAHQGDTAAARQVLERMEAFRREGGRFNEEHLMLFRHVVAGVTGGDALGPGQLRETTDYLVGYAGAIPIRAFGVGLLIYGLPGTTLQIARSVLEAGPSAEMAVSMLRGKAYAWAARGAWDSAAVSVDQWVRSEGSWTGRLGGYGLLVTGAALGAIDPGVAAERAPGAAPPEAAPDQRAELAWLEGVLAWRRGDTAAVRVARDQLQATGGRFVSLLDRSLEALGLDAAGGRAQAVDRMIALETESAQTFQHHAFRHLHGHLSTVNRVILGRWLLDADRAADAVEVLAWNEAVLSGAPLLEVVNRTAGILGLYERARAEDRMGRRDDARLHYDRFIKVVDRPTPALRPLVEAARSRAAELRPRLRG